MICHDFTDHLKYITENDEICSEKEEEITGYRIAIAMVTIIAIEIVSHEL
jgi:hypothetical protein